MNISKSGTLGRFYHWYYEDISDQHCVPRSTNLCQFCRTVFLRIPLIILISTVMALLAIAAVLFLFFILIPDNLGWTFHYLFWICVASGFVGWYLGDNDLIPQSHFHVTAPEPVTVLWAWIVAKKQKICPFIEWTE